MGDTWLDPDTCGVKLAEFEHMTQQMTQAAPKLAELADELWQALHAAQVSTAPAMEIKRIAAWADRAASDLRRRNQLAHDMDRQKLAFTICRQDGDYLKLPDRYTDQVGYAAGRRSADLFRRAASGDAEAKAALRRLRPEDITPMFAKGLLEALGPEALLKLPMNLALPLAADVRRHREGVDANAAEARATLALLGRSLALATRPDTRAYLGDDYLRHLAAAGRKNFPPLSAPPNGTSGYQSLGTLLTAAGDTHFSTRFIEVVGSDMIAYDSRLRKTFGQEPLPTLTGKAGLGNALDPTTTKVVPSDHKTDFLAPLLTAAALSGKEASQALLTHVSMGPYQEGTEPDFKGTTLQYLLHDRRPTWGLTDHGTALGKTIQTAATGQDEESTRLAFDVAKILTADARANFVVKDRILQIPERGPFDALAHGELGDAIARPKHYDELSGLRPAMATVLVAHLEKLHDIVRLSDNTKNSGSTGLTGQDLDYLLVDVTRDAGAYERLLTGQIAHTKLAIDRTVAENGELSDAITGEGRMLGHLLEARNQSVGAEEGRLAEDLNRMRKYVGFSVGLVPIAPTMIAERIPGGGKAAEAAMLQLTGKMTDVAAKRLADKGDQRILASTTETEAVEQLFNQMILSSMVAHGRLDGPDLAGQPFATKGPHPRVRPIESMSDAELERFLYWAEGRLHLGSIAGDVQTTIRNGREKTAGHYKGSDGKSVTPSPQR
ncbi:hypothetical protein [Actinomadura bangladeshensis]|uniref:Uncharacterized protein n=1 Tax=Actinomadura bangladeshensis TaxID=453573 RepID=A0A6L9QVW7_9ACTN|nr:hypothetical protein [Actinomadura bangladeshensis]NEA29625.1 hypothetical protein [Actinomadura bangladeshensis]